MFKGPAAGRMGVFLGCIMAWGCWPSHRMVHEGNFYFEHCYAADFDAKIANAQREACWNAWLAHYTRHQAAHRIDYAMRRVEAIQAGEPTLKLPGLPGGQAEAPTDPKTAGLVTLRGAAAVQEVGTTLPRTQGAEATMVPAGCASACTDFEARCTAQCPDDAASCKPLCARDHAICLEGCY